MKLDNIVNDNLTDEYKELADKFIKEYSNYYKIYMTKHGYLHNEEQALDIDIRQANNDVLHLFDENGISILRFGSFEYGSFTVCDIKEMRSFKNMPQTAKNITFLDLPNVDVFECDISSWEFCNISRCGITNLKNMTNVKHLDVNSCNSISKLDNLPDNPTSAIKTAISIYKSHMDLTQPTNSRIDDLSLSYITGMSNCKNLPRYITYLQLSSLVGFNSWIGIDEYEYLTNLHISAMTQHNNIITLLLCKKIKNVDFRFSNCLFPGRIENTISKFMYTKNRSDHIMDCAVELIDAGFPEAAEL